ncbi:hypothetical protein BKA70DRAFT_1241271 [Coprinopsis sp. MPI-PUGE-AT-0042]|nr:hypothetical protein BKA70DRAFT_1241261 [Coprinopsis sp. MPI-PUGE-AT-0042]KAH6872120.1 hypothetical protein BKA70DRAFT_1241271 [Coprinopsis sp. MPI-PUGE-AT-0042]
MSALPGFTQRNASNLAGKAQPKPLPSIVQHGSNCPAKNISLTFHKDCTKDCKTVTIHGTPSPSLPHLPLLLQPGRPGSFTWTTFNPGRTSLSGTIGSTFSSTSLRSLSVRASVVFEHLSTSTVPRIVCPDCGLTFCEDLDPVISTDKQAVCDIRSSIDEKQPNVPALVAELTGRYHYAQLVLRLAELQLRYALGVFLERSNQRDMEEALLHSTIHQSNGRLNDMYNSLNGQMKDVTYVDVPRVVKTLPTAHFALLSAHGVDYSRVKSESVFEELADEANDHFDRPMRSGLTIAGCA